MMRTSWISVDPCLWPKVQVAVVTALSSAFCTQASNRSSITVNGEEQITASYRGLMVVVVDRTTLKVRGKRK